jgi:hypothetical protein
LHGNTSGNSRLSEHKAYKLSPAMAADVAAERALRIDF